MKYAKLLVLILVPCLAGMGCSGSGKSVDQPLAAVQKKEKNFSQAHQALVDQREKQNDGH